MKKLWPLVRFGKILRRAERFEERDALKEYPFAGTYSFARGIFVGATKSGSSFALPRVQRIKKGDFVYCKIMAWEGAFGIVPDNADNCVLSGAFVVYEIDHKQIEPRFLEHYFKIAQNWSAIGSLSTGTNVRRRSLHPAQFEDSEMPLPPLSEQRRIIARIEELSTKIEEACTLRKQAAEEAEALFYVSLRQTRQRLLGSSHPKSRLGSLTKLTSGGTPSRDNPAFWNGDIPWIKTGELLDGDISKAEEHITQNGVKSSSAKLFPSDTVLIALYGQGQTRGRTGRLLIPATTNQACCAVLPNPGVFEPRFIQFWLRSLYVELREEAQGGAQPNWNSAMIKELEIALPLLSEQHRIVAYLDDLQAKVDSIKKLQNESEAELNAVMPSILSKAFAGEL